MIVRVSTEGQYRLDDALLPQLNALDNQLVAAVTAGDALAFQKLFRDLLDFVRQHGQPVAPEEIVPSDLILPAPDLTFDEARALFQGEGVIPG